MQHHVRYCPIVVPVVGIVVVAQVATPIVANEDKQSVVVDAAQVAITTDRCRYCNDRVSVVVAIRNSVSGEVSEVTIKL
jgi:hypothetical protein